MPAPPAALGAGTHQPFLNDGSNPVRGVERLEASDVDDLVLDRDQSGPEQLGQHAAPRCRPERAQHQAAAGVVSDAIHHRLQVAFLGPGDVGTHAGNQYPAAPKKVYACDHQKLYICPVFCATRWASS